MESLMVSGIYVPTHVRGNVTDNYYFDSYSGIVQTLNKSKTANPISPKQSGNVRLRAPVGSCSRYSNKYTVNFNFTALGCSKILDFARSVLVTAPFSIN